MKSIFRNLIVAAFAAGLATSATAAPPGKGAGTFKGATTEEQIMNLKKDDRYAVVCMNCKSITMKEVTDEKEVAALCHNGGTVHCDSCKKDFTVKHVGPPDKGLDKTEITIVNAEGKPCMFVVPMK